ncbi:hypothetical protein LEP1GSC193_3940 [Leptospira alstonii serovar Pingchang str. 80-412]|uniref:Uncharacterized protein n=2 Tax=Leptospira alstonii TaxID=28452 RepID=M6D6S1_9LEPT|nr:hypothetical protein LEP1GSC194_0948 [Leptospira alstonii serovar Sichuan str. 79601]EQA82259.1 hypothetical protein LEP1GSC193_3940 [Leptospira alstonii serovar Pingchang str. 80-412]
MIEERRFSCDRFGFEKIQENRNRKLTEKTQGFISKLPVSFREKNRR